MRPIHFGLAIIGIFALLALVWLALQSEPVRAGDVARLREQADREGAHAPIGADASAATVADGAVESERSSVLPPPSTTDSAASPIRASRDPEVVGRVVDGEGNAIAGADVYASNGNDWVAIPLDVEPEGVPRGWIKIERATTDAQGRFVIRGLSSGALRVAVRAAGFAPRAIEDAVVPEDAPRALADIVLERGVVLSGRVVDATGRGVSGAVLLSALDGTVAGARIALPGRGVPVATTTEDGAFRIDSLAAGAWHLIVDSPNHAPSEERGETQRAGEEVRGLVFRIELGSEIEGLVQWASAGPPAGVTSVRISARPSRDNAADDSSRTEGAVDPLQSRPRHAPVDAQGKFVVRGVLPGRRYLLTAWQPSADVRGFKSLGTLDPVNAFAGERGVVLSERPSTALLLRAIDDATGAPIESLVVLAGVGRERALRDDKNEVQTQFPDGRVRYPDLRPQPAGKPILLRVTSPGYRDVQRRDIAFVVGADIDLGDVRLVREHALTVSVVDDASGAPIEDARVLVDATGEDQSSEYLDSPPASNFHGLRNMRFGRTAADGRVRLSSFPGQTVFVRAGARGFMVCEPRRELLPIDADLALELRLRHGGRVIVRVSDPTGNPVASIGIAHRPPDSPATVGEDDGSFEAVATTDARGVARFDALAVGSHAFRAFDGPAARADAVNAAWVPAIVAEGTESAIELHVRARARVAGQVREAGQPLALARLRLVERRSEPHEDDDEENDPSLGARTDAHGRFLFASVRAGSYDLCIAHTTRRMIARFPVELRGGDNSFDFDLDVASIEGRVTDVDDQPLAHIDLRASIPGGLDNDVPLNDIEIREDERGNTRYEAAPTARPVVKTDSQGRYTLRGVLSNQPLVVEAQGETIETAASDPITLAPDEVRRGIDFRVRRAGALEVTLVGDLPGNNRPWFEVRIEPIDPAATRPARTTHVGTWQRTQRVNALGPGRYRVRFFPLGDEKSDRAQSREVEIAAGEVARLSFVVP